MGAATLLCMQIEMHPKLIQPTKCRTCVVPETGYSIVTGGPKYKHLNAFSCVTSSAQAVVFASIFYFLCLISVSGESLWKSAMECSDTTSEPS